MIHPIFDRMRGGIGEHAHFRAPPFQTHPKFYEKTPKREREERKKIVAGEGRKSAKFWASHPSGPHPSGPPPIGALTFSGFGPPPFGAPSIRGRTDCETTKTQILAKNGLAKNGLSRASRQFQDKDHNRGCLARSHLWHGRLDQFCLSQSIFGHHVITANLFLANLCVCVCVCFVVLCTSRWHRLPVFDFIREVQEG